MCHGTPTGGHVGPQQTAKRILDYGFYCPTIFRDAPLFGWLFVIESGGKLVMTTSYMIKNLGLHVLYKSNVAVFL